MIDSPAISEVGDGIHLIRVPLPFPRLRWVNVYVLGSPAGPVVIDCGVDSPEGFVAFEEGLGKLGYGVADTSVLVGTHHHVDHIGMAGRVMDVSRCAFIMHEAVRGRFDEYNDWNEQYLRLAELAAAHGAPADDVAEIAARSPRPDWAPPARDPTRLVKDGDTIAIGERQSLLVIHTPGHEESHICLRHDKTGILFSGDHILPRITPVVLYDEQGSDQLGKYLGSLERIERLDQALTMPAHGPAMERGSARARQIALHHERRLGAIIHELRSHGELTAWEVMLALFRPHLEVFEQRLAFSETLAHMEHLKIAGEIERSEQGSTIFYSIRRRRST